MGTSTIGFTLDEYLSMGNSNRTVLFLVPNRKVEMDLESNLMFHCQKETVWRAWDSVGLPVLRPQRLWDWINETDIGVRRFLIGVSEYLHVIDSELRGKMWQHIFRLIDGQFMDLDIIMDESDYEERYFDREKYEGSLQIVRLRDAGAKESEPTGHIPHHIRLVPAYYDVKADFISIPVMLQRMHDIDLPDSVTVSVSMDVDRYRGLNSRFSQFTDCEYIHHLFGIWVDDGDAKGILDDMESSGLDPEVYQKERIPWSGDSDVEIFHKLWTLNNDSLSRVYCQISLKFVTKDSYLYKVLMTMGDGDSFKDMFVIQVALNELSNPMCESWSSERQRYLATVNESHRIAEFVSNVKGIESAIPWLNCGTEAEHCELIRRVADSDLRNGLPIEIARQYPQLGMYLSESDYIPAEYRDYFREYRALKVMDYVTPEFVQMAESIKVDRSVKSRATVLSEYDVDENILQVVDGLGCEYIPYIEAIMGEYGFKVEGIYVVWANLPTITEFNDIEWTPGCVLNEIKCVDNIAHNGKSAHEINTHEENLEAVLSQLQHELVKRVLENIDSGKRIIITSDHGTSRLVTLADKQGLSSTIPYDNPDSWRYVKDNGRAQPEGVETAIANNVNYWVAKGYHHFNKKGGNRTNEHHGGGSIEERLVPIIVLNGRTRPIKFTPSESKTVSTEHDSSQIIENDIFKDL